MRYKRPVQTEQEIVEYVSRTSLRIKKQSELRDLRGKVEWQADLDQMRTTV